MSFEPNYEQIRLLGEGTYGKAFLVRSKSDQVTIFTNSYFSFHLFSCTLYSHTQLLKQWI